MQLQRYTTRVDALISDGSTGGSLEVMTLKSTHFRLVGLEDITNKAYYVG